MEPIPYNKPYATGKEIQYISDAVSKGMLKGGGPFSRKCEDKIQLLTRSPKAVLTHSCTASLEMAALLLKIQAEDEVILPSFTFLASANPFVLRGAIPVFVDIRADTLNIDETLIETAITPRTRAIVVVHYAGVSCEMTKILEIANRHGLMVVEDAAHGIMASYRGRPLGTMGHLGTYSFHESKNLISGEGGCLLVNEEKFIQRAEVIADRGTDRAQFLLGQTRNYGWVEMGSAFQATELAAAYLWAQLEEAESITERRLALWNYYQDKLAELEANGYIQRPDVPLGCSHNAHLYYLLIKGAGQKERLLLLAKEESIGIVEHYRPLHSSVGGKLYGHVRAPLTVTSMVADQLVRLPIWIGLDKVGQDRVIHVFKKALTIL